MQTCPTCTSPREGALRFCGRCGLDFWRAAAGESGHANTDVVRQLDTVSPERRRESSLLFVGVIGVIVLGVLGLASAMMLGVVRLDGIGLGAVPSATAPSAEEQLVARVYRQLGDSDAAFAVVSRGEVRVSGLPEEEAPLSVTTDMRLHGGDWSGTQSVVQDGEMVFDVEVAWVDGIGYIRMPDEEWVSEELPARFGVASPFARISAATEIEYLESEVVDGERRHRVVVTKWLGGREFTDELNRFAQVTSKESRTEILVDDDGVPISAQVDMTVVAHEGTVTATFDISATYEISDWGDVEPIEPPI